MTDHIAARAGFLAALPAHDPERLRAEEHARTCPPCREALDEGFRLVALLQRALPPHPPPASPARGLAGGAPGVAAVAPVGPEPSARWWWPGCSS
jgi:hypothetical protein